jgi:deoxyribonuclease-4
MFAAGHDLTADGGVAAMLGELGAVTGTAGPGSAGPGTAGPGTAGPGTGVGRVKLVHANDSLLGCGAKRDRHETIGAGMIGKAPFRELLAALPDVPFVVETPGGKAGHARDIATLKELRAAR